MGLGKRPNHPLSHIITNTILGILNINNIDNDDEANVYNMLRTMLVFHVNIVLAGRHDSIISKIWKTSEVRLFKSEYKSLK